MPRPPIVPHNCLSVDRFLNRCVLRSLPFTILCSDAISIDPVIIQGLSNAKCAFRFIENIQALELVFAELNPSILRIITLNIDA